ncbi:hypothetical protein [Roseovarius sp.]|uniref:hypothetical protein n=1 Tax=Roseovarius sp. TaxID=1486281 RepID=UPI00356A596A
MRDVTPPLAERITAPAHDQLSECDAEQLYYGIGIPPDPEQARACALRRLDANPDPFDGAGLLTMIHANGRGGKRDLDLAIHYACRMGGAPAEMAGRIERLMRIRAGEEAVSSFSVCDDATSGFLAGRCALHEWRITQADRNAQFALLASQFDDGEKQAFAQLRKAAETYATQSAGGEIDQTGTMRVAFITARQDEVLSGFSMLLIALEDQLPPKPDVGFADLNARLNAIFQDVMAARFPFDDLPGGITRDGIRDAARAWIGYRDAWVAFAEVRHPWLNTSALKAHLTQERYAFLKNLRDMVE